MDFAKYPPTGSGNEGATSGEDRERKHTSPVDITTTNKKTPRTPVKPQGETNNGMTELKDIIKKLLIDNNAIFHELK